LGHHGTGKNEITGNKSGGPYFSSSREAGRKKRFRSRKKTDILNDLDIKIHQKEEISKVKIQGTIVRSKTRWYNEGEKNTKYFLNLEKRHFNKKKTLKPFRWPIIVSLGQTVKY